MDSTTIFLMRQAATVAKRSSDSLIHYRDSVAQVAKEVARQNAEWVLLRHDLILLGMVLIPCITAIYIAKTRNEK